MTTDEYSVGKGMLRLALSCRRFQKGLAADTGLTTNEILCLLVLRSEEPGSVGELSHMLDLSLTSTSKILSKLQGKGQIERNLDVSDRRRERVTLTPRGIGVSERLLWLSKDLAIDVLRSLPEHMRMEFAKWIEWYSVENSLHN